MAEPEEIVIEPTRKFQGKFSSSLAARAELFYALRKMSDEDYHAGRRVTVNWVTSSSTRRRLTASVAGPVPNALGR